MAAPGSGDGLVLLTNSDAGLTLGEPLLQAASFLSAGLWDTLCGILRVCL